MNIKPYLIELVSSARDHYRIAIEAAEKADEELSSAYTMLKASKPEHFQTRDFLSKKKPKARKKTTKTAKTNKTAKKR